MRKEWGRRRMEELREEVGEKGVGSTKNGGGVREEVGVKGVGSTKNGGAEGGSW